MAYLDSRDLANWKKYFIDRVDELRAIAGTPFGFAGACILIEVLSRLTRGTGKGKSGRLDYEQFVCDWMPKKYSEFKFAKRVTPPDKEEQDKYLPTQMYCILRCGLVHNLSFVAGNSEIANGATDRSIWMLTREEADALRLKHLGSFEQVGPPVVEDAALFVAEDFLDDIEGAVRAIFKKAEHDEVLKENIVRHLSDRCPILA
ncbi:MAG: hypothetical protein SFY67_01400 [Candidatus Melainabacteria bacterium]|nr:hypothetical protein [Candidatus Melainabacteria bacterium]